MDDSQLESIVDQWFQGKVDTNQTIHLNEKKKTPTIIQQNNKFGLGYSSKTKDQAPKAENEALQKRLQLKRKDHSNNNKSDLNQSVQHGVIEQDFIDGENDSRTHFISKKNIKTIVNPVSNKEKEVKVKKSSSLSELQSESSTNSIDKITIIAANVEDTKLGRKRQRTKTRSKQKNIRKDTRTAEAKPSYLQSTSHFYSGRILTDETKKVLVNKGICDTSFPPSNNGNWKEAQEKQPETAVTNVDVSMGVDLAVGLEKKKKKKKTKKTKPEEVTWSIDKKQSEDQI